MAGGSAGTLNVRRPRYVMLDLWRGAAALWVVIHHAALYAGTDATAAGTGVRDVLGRFVVRLAQGGWYGVPIFFVISGYCIAATAESHYRNGHAIKTFFWRRFRRIFPPYWAALAVTLAIYGVAALFSEGMALNEKLAGFPPLRALTPLHWFGNLTLTDSWLHHVLGGESVILLGPSWSLMYEEQFYLVCGLCLVLFGARFLRGAVGVTVLVGLVMLATRGSWPEGVAGFFFDGRWLLFALGLAVYFYLNHAAARVRRLLLGGFALALTWSVALRNGWLGVLQSPIQRLMSAEFVAGALFALVLIVFHRWDAAWRGHPALRPVAFLGRISYSLYIVHFPIANLIAYGLFTLGVVSDWQVMLITIPIATGASVLCGALFFHVVERRFLNSPTAGPVPDT